MEKRIVKYCTQHMKWDILIIKGIVDVLTPLSNISLYIHIVLYVASAVYYTVGVINHLLLYSILNTSI